MKNYRTTVGAVVTLIVSFASRYGFEMGIDVQLAIIIIGTTVVAIFTKDSNVTGGTKPQTKEAEDRANVSKTKTMGYKKA